MDLTAQVHGSVYPRTAITPKTQSVSGQFDLDDYSDSERFTEMIER